jgi:hypothetical protein
MVSVARIRFESWKSARAFKGIICDNISEFESYMPSHAVSLCGLCSRDRIWGLACRLRLSQGCRSRRADRLRHRSCGHASSGRLLHRSNPQGRQPADLPVLQSTKFEFIINLQTAYCVSLWVYHRLAHMAWQAHKVGKCSCMLRQMLVTVPSHETWSRLRLLLLGLSSLVRRRAAALPPSC